MASKKQSPQKSSSVAALRAGKTQGSGSPKGGTAPSLWENVKAILVTLAFFLVFRTFLIEAYRIPSPSMVPTLLVGDWLFVNKLVYGPHVPFTDINLPGYAEPKRGEVVVFISPPQVDQPEDPTPILVKRCVAIAGDTIWMRNGLLYVNGTAQPQGPAFSANVRGVGSDSYPLFQWQKPFQISGASVGDAPERITVDDWGPLVVPAEHLFMLGDNRYDSKDGRYWGFVPRENVRGRPVFVYYSYRSGESDRPLPFITDIRWSRIGTILR